jgi:hypothetical protein
LNPRKAATIGPRHYNTELLGSAHFAWVVPLTHEAQHVAARESTAQGATESKRDKPAREKNEKQYHAHIWIELEYIHIQRRKAHTQTQTHKRIYAPHSRYIRGELDNNNGILPRTPQVFFFGMVARCQIIFRTTGMRLKSFLGCSYFECCTVYGLLLFRAMYSGRYVSSHPQKFQKKKIHLKGPIWSGDVELSASIVKKFIRLFFFLFSCHY